MNGHDESDSFVVPKKSGNKAARAVADPMEGRELAKGNPDERNSDRAQDRGKLQNAIGRIREAAKKDGRQRFTSLYHHIYDVQRLHTAYEGLKPKAAAGVDGVTWQEYGEKLDSNLEDLSQRLRRGAYRARPTRRVRIPKAGGRERLLGIPALEDKIVQKATAEVLNAIYEEDFLGFSYGFRPGRNQHQALDAVSVAIRKRKVRWVLDADIRGFFDTLDHEWLVKFIEHRIADKRVIRLIQKWLKAGVLEDGKRYESSKGTVQGGNISPLLANIYLHYALDLWTQQWRQKYAHGDVIIVRYADDFIVGFQSRQEADRYKAELEERLRGFGLELHPEKTRLIEFGRFATEARRRQGKGKPETFNFLGFTHYCAKTKKGYFAVGRTTMRQRMTRKLQEVASRLRTMMHAGIPVMGRYLAAVIRGHANYYGIPGNAGALSSFRHAIILIWRKVLGRRSEKANINWARMVRLIARWIPRTRLRYVHPDGHLRVITQRRSRMR